MDATETMIGKPRGERSKPKPQPIYDWQQPLVEQSPNRFKNGRLQQSHPERRTLRGRRTTTRGN